MRTHRRSLSLLGAAALLAAAALPARAEDPPAGGGMPPPPPQHSHPLVDALVGCWDVAVEAGGRKLTGVTRFWKACDGAALVQELRTGSGDEAFHGLGVLTVAEDGKSMRQTWFDTMGGADAWVFEGASSADGWELEGDLQPGTKARVSMRRKGDAVESKMTAGDQTLYASTYTKAAKPATDEDFATSKAAVSQAFFDALPGDWTMAGTFTPTGTEAGMPYQGTVRWRRACGGLARLATSAWSMGPMGNVRDLTVAVVDVRSKTLKAWGWSSRFPAHRLEGPVTDTTWETKNLDDPTMKLSMKRSADTITVTFEVPMGTGKETHTRQPAKGG